MRHAKRVIAALAPLLALACAVASPVSPSYLNSGAYRRSEMEASLVNPDNDYSRLRLAHYAAEGPASWDALPVYNPNTSPVRPSDLDAKGGAKIDEPFADASALAITKEASAGAEDALRALGEAAFFRYPVQPIHGTEVALDSRKSAENHGLWVDEARGVGGLVRAELGDGSRTFALTCSTCHVGVRDGALTIGVGNDLFDLGRILVESSPQMPADRADLLLAWGPGRVDVTTALGIEPVRIPDLRPVRFLTHLHHDGTLRQRSLATLAIRLETLIITSNNKAVRPPREIALGLATYLWSLGDSSPAPTTSTDPERHGMALFQANCASCHAPPSFTGPPVPLDEVGTDPTLGRSPDRTTGKYRVPSLRGVATRGPLLHDGSLPSIDVMFDPARAAGPAGAFPGILHGRSPVLGHRFGLDLRPEERRDLLSYLRTL